MIWGLLREELAVLTFSDRDKDLVLHGQKVRNESM